MAQDEFTLYLDLTEVKEFYKDQEKILGERLKIAAQNLSNMTYTHIKEQASSKLHSRRDMFLDALDFFPIGPTSYVIVVGEKGRWIEDGMEPHSMLEDLLKSPKAKNKKGGGKYIVIPFKHNKGPTQQTPHQAQLKQAIQQAFKKAGIPYGQIERHASGAPKTGLLHKMNLNDPKQNRPAHGSSGPVGHAMSIDSPGTGQEGPSGRPYLWGVRVYQRALKNKDGTPKTNKAGEHMASREIFTFRVASSSQLGTNKWFHPGTAPMHFLDEALDWAKDQWDTQILPEIVRGLGDE